MKRILSLGAGVQSSTLALMIGKGEIPPVDAAVFADTQWEPAHVYRWLDYLESEVNKLPFAFPIYRVSKGSLRNNIIGLKKSKEEDSKRYVPVPFYVKNDDGTRGIGRRQCTHEFKIDPLIKKEREICGLKPRQRCKEPVCETLIGISLDEAIRMKPSRDAFNVNTWPLIDLRMSRQDCLNWMDRNGYPLPPKSSCIGCPYHSDHEWRLIKQDKESWEDAIYIDKLIRQPARGMKAEQYMHRSCVPLDEVDFSTAEERGQVDMFNNECTGMCGV